MNNIGTKIACDTMQCWSNGAFHCLLVGRFNDCPDIDGENSVVKTIPLQIVVIELEGGRRGVFVGPALVPNECEDAQCKVENVWFADVQQIPAGMAVDDVCEFAINQLESSQVECS
jgi:hypothetical protein